MSALVERRRIPVGRGVLLVVRTQVDSGHLEHRPRFRSRHQAGRFHGPRNQNRQEYRNEKGVDFVRTK
jgi:hypothetical protein